ncbi:hypothetical protein H1C71_005845 [Ictidomys tridecemlineatus]|nr:hypothetical protein H1C71_005845 [Ictidomys tridecemlineatus]
MLPITFGCLLRQGASGVKIARAEYQTSMLRTSGDAYIPCNPVSLRGFCGDCCIGRAHFLESPRYQKKHGVFSSCDPQQDCAGTTLDFIIQDLQGLQLQEFSVVSGQTIELNYPQNLRGSFIFRIFCSE